MAATCSGVDSVFYTNTHTAWLSGSALILLLLLIIIIIIIIIINENVYGDILMTMVTARVHPVHLMNAD